MFYREDSLDQFGIVDAQLRRLLGHEAERRHAGLGVDLQKNENVVNIVITKIGPGHAAAAHGRVGQFGLT